MSEYLEALRARLDKAESANDALAHRLGKVQAALRLAGASRELNRRRAAEALRQLDEALAANDALAMTHALCVVEIEQLRARLAQRDTSYHLTDAGRAAIAQPNQEQELHP